MSRRTLVIVLVAAAALGAGLFLWTRQDPKAREVRRIQERLGELAAAVSFARDEPLFRRLAYPGQVASFFSDPAVMDTTLGEAELSGTLHRSQLEELATRVRAIGRGLRVEFLDIEVQVEDPFEQATAHLTAKVFLGRDTDYAIQEFKFSLVKVQGAWRVHRVETVRTIER